ncbi:hypothetical protein [Clostridium botulinum]|nr:hypothetical protein [Clostridium botulinum]
MDCAIIEDIIRKVKYLDIESISFIIIENKEIYSSEKYGVL